MSEQKRFLTAEVDTNPDGAPNYEMRAYSEADNWRADVDAFQEWVWQYADSAEQAIAQHEVKHAAWAADIEAGREPRNTY